MGLIEQEPFYDRNTQLRLGRGFRGTLHCDLVDEQGRVLELKDLSYVNHGCNSEVWKWEKDGKCEAVKLYFDQTLDFCMAPDVFQVIKNLDFVNMPNVYSVLRKSSKRENEVSGYSMDYLEEDLKGTFLDSSTTNLVSSFRLMEQDAKLLASNHVVMRDVSPDNVMITKGEGIARLFDFDLFTVEDTVDSDYISNYHKERLFSLMYHKFQEELFMDSLMSLEEKEKSLQYLDSVFNQEIHPSISPSKMVSFTFANEETPRQYLKKVCSN